MYSFFSISLLLSSVALASNDWSRPCFDGHCSYDLTKSDGSGIGSVIIDGSPDAIADITPAAGWAILGCSPDAEAQDIRIVCASADQKKCAHLYRSIGPSGKIVRLPENCGRMAFARIANTWVDEDQRIPESIAKHLQRRGIRLPQVKGIAIDTDFAAIDASKTGEVTIRIEGMTIPGANGNMHITPPSRPLPRRRSRLAQRGLGSFIEEAFASFASVNSLSRNLTFDLPPVQVKRNFELLSASLTCPLPGTEEFAVSVNANLDANVYAAIQIGVVAQGTIIPPKLDDFGLFAGMDAHLEAKFNLAASAKTPISSGLMTFIQAGLPGLDFPGILTIGPIFKLQGSAIASIEADVNLSLGVSYHASNAKLYFPSSSKQQSGGSFGPGNSPLKLTADTSVKAKGRVEAHLIPKVEFGIVALQGLASATVSLNLDASASLSLTVDGEVNDSAKGQPNPPRKSKVSNNNISPPIGRPAVPIPSFNPPEYGTLPTPYPIAARPSHPVAYPPRVIRTQGDQHPPIPSSSSSDPSTSEEKLKARSAGSAGIKACIDVTGGFNVYAAANANFFGLFNPGTRVDLFGKNFNVYNDCLGTRVSTRDLVEPSYPPPRVSREIEAQDNQDESLKQQDIPNCSIPKLAGLLALVDTSVLASSIKPKP